MAILNVHGIGSQTCRVNVVHEGQDVFNTGWSSVGGEEQGWSEPQVAQVRVPMDGSGTVVLQIIVQGKMNRKAKFGEVRLSVADALTRTTMPLWLDLEGGDKGSLSASLSGSQRLKFAPLQHFPPQVLVKLLYVPKALGASAALFQSRRKKLLEAPLPELLSETVKELAVPRKPLPASPGDADLSRAALKSPGRRKDSLLLQGGAKEALVLMSAHAESSEDIDFGATNSYMAVSNEAIEEADANGEKDVDASMYKCVDDVALSLSGSGMESTTVAKVLSPKVLPPRPDRKKPASAPITADGFNGYRSIDNSALEAEMEQVMQERLPVAVRGRASSIMSRIVREKDEWRDMDSFNARFQDAVETMNMHGAQSNTRRKELIESCLTVIRLAQDFATLASQYGKTIISEHALPEGKRTIKPRKDLGGVLGGEKFIVLGIMFKFASDEKNLFKSLQEPMEAANKIAGLELKGE